MMLPTLISVSVAPVSYFFCASAPLVVAASKASAAGNAVRRMDRASIMDLRDRFFPSFFGVLRLLSALNTPDTPVTRKSPCDQIAGAPGVQWCGARGVAIIPVRAYRR